MEVPDGTKADIARFLFAQTEGYSVTEVSDAIPMAYSQAHSIKKKMDGPPPANEPKPHTSKTYQTQRGQKLEVPSDWGPKIGTRAKSTKPIKASILEGKMPKPRKGIGKLRTPGLPSDTDVGECVNCGHDLIVRLLPTGYTLVHVNVSAEEMLNTTQFCQAVPKVLVA